MSVCIWNDAKFTSMSDDSQLLFLFILTHPQMTSIGAMRITLSGLAEEKGWSKERLSKAFLEVSGKGLLEYDSERFCLILPKFIKHNPPESPNVITGWSKTLDLIPECGLRIKQIQNVRSYIYSMGESFVKAFERLPEVFRKSMPNQEQEQEQEQEEIYCPSPEGPPAHSSNGVPYKQIVDYLNEKTGKRFSAGGKETQRHIKARWNSGFRLEDFQRVIDIKCAKWLTDSKMVDYLRPETLFGTKFESYLNEVTPSQSSLGFDPDLGEVM